MSSYGKGAGNTPGPAKAKAILYLLPDVHLY
jgi:hypothetical protein